MLPSGLARNDVRYLWIRANLQMNPEGRSILMDLLCQRGLASIVLLLGMWVAILNYRHSPRRSKLVLAGTSLLLVNSIGSALAYAYLVTALDETAIQWMKWGRVALSIAIVLLNATGIGLLLSAIYWRRDFER